jgi:hypothetical protein
MTIAEQVASDFAEVVGDLATTATTGSSALTGVLSQGTADAALEDGGYGVTATATFRYGIESAAGFVPSTGAMLQAGGRTWRIEGVATSTTHGIVTLTLSQSR